MKDENKAKAELTKELKILREVQGKKLLNQITNSKQSKREESDS